MNCFIQRCQHILGISVFFVADDADIGICLIFSQNSSSCFPSSKVSATALMHYLTTPPSVNVYFFLFLYHTRIQPLAYAASQTGKRIVLFYTTGVLKLFGARDPSKGRTFSEDPLIITSQIKPYRLICNVLCFWTLLL